MPKKYEIESYIPSKTDNIYTCKKETAKCPKCGNNGHVVLHVNSARQTKQDIEVVTGVNHGHFVLEKKTLIPRSDEGRNITCYYKWTMVSKNTYCNVSWSLKNNKKLPKWLRDRLTGQKPNDEKEYD